MLRRLLFRLRRASIVTVIGVCILLSLSLLAYNVENASGTTGAAGRRRLQQSDDRVLDERAFESDYADRNEKPIINKNNEDKAITEKNEDEKSIEDEERTTRRKKTKKLPPSDTDMKVVAHVWSRDMVEEKQLRQNAPRNAKQPRARMNARFSLQDLDAPAAKALGAPDSNTISPEKEEREKEAHKHEGDDSFHERIRAVAITEGGASQAPRRRIVHFDLKGSAPKVAYLQKVFKLISVMGATGVLLEWEDMFPFTGRFARFTHRNAYSVDDVRAIIETARENNLEVIPLIQTFGHLEWLLKHEEFQHLREVDRYAQTICPSKKESIKVLHEMIDQVMKMHGDSAYVHIGCDEAFQIGMCNKCVARVRNTFTRASLIVSHIAAIADYVRKHHKKKVLIWHDMLVNVDAQTLKEYDLGNLVEPVLWSYAENLFDYFNADLWAFFAKTFPYAWGASAYKGADGPDRWWANVPHYLANHASWLEQTALHSSKFREFRGIIMTGWSRFDHFAILCELLPVSLPTLAVSLHTLALGSGRTSGPAISAASRDLNCANDLVIQSKGPAAACQFPGFDAYRGIQQLRVVLDAVQEQVFDHYHAHGWLSAYQVRQNYSSSWYLDQINDRVGFYLGDLRTVVRQLRVDLKEIYFEETIDEFFEQVVKEKLERLEHMQTDAKGIAARRNFPRRPLPLMNATATTVGPRSDDAEIEATTAAKRRRRKNGRRKDEATG